MDIDRKLFASLSGSSYMRIRAPTGKNIFFWIRSRISVLGPWWFVVFISEVLFIQITATG
jgi:hypothetical protein